MLYVKEHGMKYEFVVHPKGKVSDIKLTWNGTKPDVLADGGIKYASVLGEIKESAPFSYISGSGKEVKSAFKVKGNYVGFEVGKYDESKKLVIDPLLVWGTYYGGNEHEQAWDIATDKNKFIYIVGQTRSINGIGTIGTHQPGISNSAIIYAFVAKFSSNGSREWGSYYGGNTHTFGWGVATDLNDNVYLSGHTESTTGIATLGTHQTAFGGGNNGGDAFLVKFNNVGKRVWATYYGGTESEGAYGIAVDKNDNIFLSGNTSSLSGISTSGVHQESFGGVSDAFLVKFNTNGQRIWATYFGGSARESAAIVSIDSIGNIYLSGNTSSTNGIATPGVHQETLAKSINPQNITSDAFIVKLDSTGKRQWGTYYGGPGAEGARITTDPSGNIYLTGATNSTTGIATTGTHQYLYGGGNDDAFLVKINTNGQRLWGTYLGGSDIDRSNAIVLDKSGNIYISGYTLSKNGIATSGTHQLFNTSGFDGFLVKFNNYGKRLWGTYYGGENIDLSRGIAIDDSGYIYILGHTYSSNKIASTGTHQTNYSGLEDAFIAKFLSVSPPADAGIIAIDSPSVSFCTGNYNINVRAKNYSYLLLLDSMKIGWSINGNLQKEFKWQGILKSGDTTLSINIGSYTFDSGTFLIKAWTYLPNGITDSINNNDTFSFVINVHPFPQANTGGNKILCLGEKTTIGGSSTAGNLYSWTSIPSGFTSSSSNPAVSPLATTIYYLTETNNITGCAKTDSVKITVVPKPIIQISGDSFICNRSGSVYKAIKTPGTLYSWSLVSGNIIAGQGTDSILVIWNSTSQKGNISLNIIDSNGCSASIKKEVYIYQSPSLEIGNDKYICEDDGNLIKIEAGKEFTTYRWYPTGDTTQYLIVRKAGDYYVVVQDKCGNPLQDDIKIAARCPVLIYIPSAFTPDGNGLNETFQPVGNHISEEGYNFSIYNRWGERIFISTDYNTGWDGKFESNSVPEGIYLWMLECTVKEGALIRKLHKTGTVQLLK